MRTIRWAAIGIVGMAGLGLGGLLLLLAAVPRVAGDWVGSGMSAPEASLCALDNGGNVPLLVAGDSRAKVQVSPAVLQERLGVQAVNVGDIYALGGDVATLANSLKGNPRPLACRPALVISVSYYELNDWDLDEIPLALLFNWRLRDHARMAAVYPGKYFPFLVRRFLPALKRTAMHHWKRDGFVCREGELPYYPVAMRDSLGFAPSTGRRGTATAESQGGREYLLDGANWRVFRNALEWLAGSGAGALVIYNGPMDPDWRPSASASGVGAVERAFSDSLFAYLSALSTRQPVPIRFLDFYRHPPRELRSEHFYDRNHLNAEGARLFSAALADSLRPLLGKPAGPAVGVIQSADVLGRVETQAPFPSVP